MSTLQLNQHGAAVLLSYPPPPPPFKPFFFRYHVLRRMLDRAQFGGSRQLVLEPVEIMEKCRSSQDTSLALLEKEGTFFFLSFCCCLFSLLFRKQ